MSARTAQPTVMAEAFKAAGYAAPSERLREIATEALEQFPKDWASLAMVAPRTDPLWSKLKEIAMQALIANARNWDGAKDAVYQAVRNDAALLWALFEPYRALAVQKLLTEMAQEMRVEEMARRGQTAQGDQKEAAPSRQGGGQLGIARQIGPAPSTPSGMAARSEVVRLTLLDTFKINNRPIGDCTPEEANGWAASRERDARFVRLLTANLPLDRPIRQFVRGDEAQKLWEQAEDARNAA